MESVEDTELNEAVYKWKVRFEITPKLLKPESIGDYKFEIDKDNTYVDYFYETKSFDKNIERKFSEEQAIANQHQSKIRELMIQRMINLKIAEDIEVKDPIPILMNIEELEQRGLPVNHYMTISVISRNSIYDVDDSLKASCEFWNSGFKYETKVKTKEELEEDIFRLSEWLILAEKQNDNIKSFILTWIAFNGLYNLFSSVSLPKSKLKNPQHKPDDTEKFEHTIGKLLKNEAGEIVTKYHDLFDALQNFDFSSASGGTNYSNDLKKLRSQKKPHNVKIIKCATKCIYDVRKRVFHEASNMENAEEYCKNSKRLLSIITMQCLKNFVLYKR